MDRVGWRANKSGENGTGRFKAGVLFFQLAVFLCDLQEFAVVRLAPIPKRAFSLLDNGLDGFDRRGQIGDLDEFGPRKVLLRRLGPRRTDEDLLFAIFVHQVPESLLDAAVEVPNRGK